MAFQQREKKITRRKIKRMRRMRRIKARKILNLFLTALL
jgi:hypothetical protein